MRYSEEKLNRPTQLSRAFQAIAFALIAGCTGAPPPVPPSPPQPTPSGQCTGGSAARDSHAVEHGKKPVLVASGLIDPEGLAVRADGVLYVSDAGRHAVYQVISPKSLKRLARFAQPMGLALGCFGDIYVADQQSGVKVISSNGSTRTLATFASSFGPFDVAFDEATGNVYVSDPGTPLRVAKILPDGKIENLPPRFSFPWGIALRDEDLLVYDQGPSTVYEVKPDGTKSAIAPVGSFMNASGGLAVGRDGEVFVSDTFDVKEISAAGHITTYADGFGSATALATGKGGALYVADSFQHAVFRVDP